jgi:hypothetical protein
LCQSKRSKQALSARLQGDAGDVHIDVAATSTAKQALTARLQMGDDYDDVRADIAARRAGAKKGMSEKERQVCLP